MPVMSLDAAVQRIAADQVVTRSELRTTARLPAAQQDPQGLADRLDPLGRKLTNRAADLVAAFKARLASPPATGSALDALTGDAAVAPALPSWLPASFDLAASADKVKAILVAQGEPEANIGAGKADKLLFTDADLTLLNTNTPTLLKHKVTGEYLRYPDTHRLVMLGIGPERSSKNELAALKTKYPSIDWASYASDFAEFGSLMEILRTAAIPEDVARLKRSDRDPMSRDFMITARSAENVPLFMDEYMMQRGVDLNGVLAVNTPSFTSSLGLTDPAYTSARKKAVAMAALIHLYGGEASIKQASFHDDTDENLFAAMELLPKLFPGIRFSFYDVTHLGDQQFKQNLVARTDKDGEMVDRSGRRLSLDQAFGYTSHDAPFPVDVVFGSQPR